MITKNKIREMFKTKVAPKERGESFAFLGNQNGVVIANDYGDVYVTDFIGNEKIVFNNTVPPIPGRAVKVGYRNNKSKALEVLGFVDAYPDKRVPSVPNHNPSHTWPSWDTIWVRTEQILSCLAMPSSGFEIEFIGFVYYLNGYHLIDNQTVDFTGHIPEYGARWILVEADSDASVYLTEGELLDNKSLLEYEHIPRPSANRFPLFAVKVYSGQSTFLKSYNDTDIVGLLFSGFSTGGSALSYKGNKFVIEALTDMIEGDIAFATDTNQIGSYTGEFWRWEGVHVSRFAPTYPYQGMLWYDTTGSEDVALVFTSSDNSMYLGTGVF